MYKIAHCHAIQDLGNAAIERMEDYDRQLDNILVSTGESVLPNAGSISHEQAVEKALAKYRKYQVKTLSDVEQAYLDTIKNVEKKIEGKKNG